MVNDRWKTVGGAAQLEDRPRDKPQRPSCGYVLCTVLLSLAVLLAVAVTGAVLFLNHAHAPGTALPPVVSTGPAGANGALVTVERCTGLRKGHGSLGQGLSTLQSEQAHLIQLLSESQSHMAHLVNLVSDVLDALHRDRGLSRPRVKADLQRAPARGLRPRSCANGSRPRDCLDVLLSGRQEDGVYSVFPTHDPAGFQVYCDMRTDGGGWTVFQRREDGSVNFFRGWEAYRDGFGKLTGEHWLGLRRLHALTAQAAYELHVDLEDFDNGTAYAHYRSFGVGLFSVDPEGDGYPLTVADYSGTAGRAPGCRGGRQEAGVPPLLGLSAPTPREALEPGNRGTERLLACRVGKPVVSQVPELPAGAAAARGRRGRRGPQLREPGGPDTAGWRDREGWAPRPPPPHSGPKPVIQSVLLPTAPARGGLGDRRPSAPRQVTSCVGPFVNAAGTAPSFATSAPNGIPGPGMHSGAQGGRKPTQGLYKAGRAREPHLLDPSPAALLGAGPQRGEYSPHAPQEPRSGRGGEPSASPGGRSRPQGSAWVLTLCSSCHVLDAAA
ncbi:PREDICTED: fibrinogen C domain-containing protein 1 [Miniopterus natalensis]|uniref:fibrinogen C domain-containing protein 1 n=1 Tax=Miniopterus natalensis TaxID=291302 RepID=UPI0007A6D813|nr:PREDICTED: fibrinogen C domain-containing protein 1 [Miniopterus natalensis]